MKSPIHQSDAERLQATTESSVSAIQATTQKMNEAIEAIKNLTNTSAALKEHINDPKGVVRKLEEVKSAGLITNKLLKDIAKREALESDQFPPEVQANLRVVKLLTVKGDKGDKGDKPVLGKDYDAPAPGKTPVKGVDYLTPEEIAEFRKSATPQKGKDYFDGRDGKTPVKNKDYFDGDSGYTPVKGVDYFDGKDGSPDSPDEVVEKVNTATKQIDPKKVRGLSVAMRQLDKIGTNPQGKLENVGGGIQPVLLFNGVRVSDFVTEINFSTGITAVYSGGGRVTLTATGGGGGFTTLAPTETPNGVLTVFTFAGAAAQPSFIISDNVMMQATTKAGTVNWTWNNAAKQATMTVPAADDLLGVV